MRLPILALLAVAAVPVVHATTQRTATAIAQSVRLAAPLTVETLPPADRLFVARLETLADGAVLEQFAAPDGMRAVLTDWPGAYTIAIDGEPFAGFDAAFRSGMPLHPDATVTAYSLSGNPAVRGIAGYFVEVAP